MTEALKIPRGSAKRKKNRLAAAGFAAAVLTAVIIGWLVMRVKPVNVELKAGEPFPPGLALISENGKACHISELKGTRKVLFYLSGTDPICGLRLSAIARMTRIFRSENITYEILWEGGIPENWIFAKGIDPALNFSLKRGNSLSKTKPNAFLLGEGNRVELAAGYSYDDLPQKLYSLCRSGDLRTAVNQMIEKDGMQGETFRRESGSCLIMFLSSSCRDCLAKEQKLIDALPAIRKKTRVITVQPDYDQKQVFENPYSCVDYSSVFFGVYRLCGHAVTLPYFVEAGRDGKPIREFTDVASLLAYYGD